MRIVTMLCGLLCFVPSAWAQENSYVDDQGSLKGLPGVSVIVEQVADVTRGAVTAALVKTDVELRLRQLGIKVFAFPPSDLDAALLNVDVSILKSDPVPTAPLFVYHVELAARQAVRLNRAQTVVTMATTWRTSSLGMVGANRFENIRQAVTNDVDAFANAFLAANQK